MRRKERSQPRMSVHALNRNSLLVPDLVKIMHAEIGPKACRKRGIGKLRSDMEEAADPTCDASLRILAEICRLCPLACELARKP